MRLTLAQMIDAESARMGGQGRLAEAIGVASSQIGLVRSGKHALGIETCVRFAAATGRRLTDVLRANGKPEMAKLLEAQFGKQRPAPRPPGLPVTDVAFLKKWHALSPKTRSHLARIIDEILSKGEQ